nr:hypothetical protein [Tanacetum cinerariifolium]
MTIYHDPSLTLAMEKMWDYEVQVHISSFKPLTANEIFEEEDATNGNPSSLKAQSSKDVKGKKKLFGSKTLSKLFEAMERKKKAAQDDATYVTKNVKVANEEWKLSKLSNRPRTTIPRNLGRLVAGDTFPGRHVARDTSNGKARIGYLPGRHSRATSSGPHSFWQKIKCHGGGFSRATCRLENYN